MWTNLSPRRPRSSPAGRRHLNDVDCIVIGAGVIGLAAARALARGGREVIILESERHFGMHTSSRNSEVIHAGIHYEPNSLKARLCVAGRDLLYSLLRRARHPASALRQAHGCHRRGCAIGGARENRIERARQRRFRSCVARWKRGAPQSSPSFSAFAPCHRLPPASSTRMCLMQSLLADAEAGGANIVYDTKVTSLRTTPRRHRDRDQRARPCPSFAPAPS